MPSICRPRRICTRGLKFFFSSGHKISFREADLRRRMGYPKEDDVSHTLLTRENVTARAPPQLPREFTISLAHHHTRRSAPNCLQPDCRSQVLKFHHTLHTTMADEKPTEYVTLVSNDGFEFKILRSAACIAGTIKKALDPLCKNSSHTSQHTQGQLTNHASWLPRKCSKSRRPTYDQVRPLLSSSLPTMISLP
jgi:hypothetical protein